MQMSAVVLIGVATLANGGLWLWSRPKLTVPAPEGACAIGVRAEGTDNARLTSTVAAVLSTGRKVQSTTIPSENGSEKNAAGIKTPVLTPDQPWLSNVRDGVLQVAQSGQFYDKLTIADVQCQGSTCAVTGSTQTSSDGQRHGAADVARLMNAMDDGQIAGGDTGRAVLMTSVQTDPQNGGTNFALQIQPVDGTPSNPCQAVLDQWNTMHPGDFTVSTPDLVVVANIQTRTLKTEVEKGSM